MARLPTQNLLHKLPGIPQGGFQSVAFDQLGDRARVDRALPQGRETQSLQETGRDDETYRLNMVQPLEVGIAFDVCGHGDHPETGQR